MIGLASFQKHQLVLQFNYKKKQTFSGSLKAHFLIDKFLIIKVEKPDLELLLEFLTVFQKMQFYNNF